MVSVFHTRQHFFKLYDCSEILEAFIYLCFVSKYYFIGLGKNRMRHHKNYSRKIVLIDIFLVVTH